MPWLFNPPSEAPGAVRIARRATNLVPWRPYSTHLLPRRREPVGSSAQQLGTPLPGVDVSAAIALAPSRRQDALAPWQLSCRPKHPSEAFPLLVAAVPERCVVPPVDALLGGLWHGTIIVFCLSFICFFFFFSFLFFFNLLFFLFSIIVVHTQTRNMNTILFSRSKSNTSSDALSGGHRSEGSQSCKRPAQEHVLLQHGRASLTLAVVGRRSLGTNRRLSD